MINIKKLLGLGTRVGIEAFKENIEADAIGLQIDTLVSQMDKQIEDNLEDQTKITELQNELQDIKETLKSRNARYAKLLEVLS